MATNRNSLSARLDFARKNNSTVASTLRPASPLEAALAEEEEFNENCICKRQPKTLVCIFCKMFTFGRISKICPVHRNVTYLMDFMCCPYCSGPTDYLHVVEMNYDEFYKP